MSADGPRYVQRLARLPRVLAHLATEPDGMPVAELAAQFDINPDELREDLLAYYTADVGTWMFGLTRADTLEFLGSEGDTADPTTAIAVRMVAQGPMADVGVEYLSASELALIYAAATTLLDSEPDNEPLASAVELIAESMLDSSATIAPGRGGQVPVSVLRAAQESLHAVRIEYSRAWEKGVSTRVIHPYRLVNTRRGWEVDAGPVAENGNLRTFLIGNIRSVEVLDDTFELPAGLTDLLARQRATTRVRMQIPHESSWAAYLYAERVHRIEEDDLTFTADLDLLPPHGRRVALIAMASLDDTRVLDPAPMALAVSEMAAELLDHHRLGPEAKPASE